MVGKRTGWKHVTAMILGIVPATMLAACSDAETPSSLSSRRTSTNNLSCSCKSTSSLCADWVEDNCAPPQDAGLSPRTRNSGLRDAGSTAREADTGVDDDEDASTGASVTCTSFTYSEYGPCQTGQQTRTVLSKSPTGCTGGNPVLTQACTAALDGNALYTQYCSGCHGDGKKGSSANSTQRAINNNRGGMGSLKNLTPEQIQAISKAN